MKNLPAAIRTSYRDTNILNKFKHTNGEVLEPQFKKEGKKKGGEARTSTLWNHKI